MNWASGCIQENTRDRAEGLGEVCSGILPISLLCSVVSDFI